MDSLPPVLLDFISRFRPLLRAEVFESFTYLLCGLRSSTSRRAVNPSGTGLGVIDRSAVRTGW
jgi:hypothetical protein